MHVFILLDRTGSMASLWKEAVSSVNAYVEGLAKEVRGGRHKATLAVFDEHNGTQFDIMRNAVSLREWKPFQENEAPPRGCTPLYDSIAKIIALAEEKDASKTVIVVMTDGYENASREVTKKQAKEAIERVQNKNWQVVFLGANFDAFPDASSIGVPLTHVITWAPGHAANAMDSTLHQTVNYCHTGKAMYYNSDDRTSAGEDKVVKR